MKKGPCYFAPAESESRTVDADLCVYGGTSGGIIAAIEGAERGLKVVLLAQLRHLGGLTSGGLGMTDIGNKTAIGGKSLQFYKRVGACYGAEIEWRFEPSVAEKVFEDWLKGTSVQIYRGQYVDKVIKENGSLRSLLTVSGLQVNAKVFIDASYEGDLLAFAGVSYHIGREANTVYGETFNGQQLRNKHQFERPVDPYVVPDTPASGLLPGIEDTQYQQGAGDHRIQAYNFRMCLTQRADIRVPFPKPAAYEEAMYLLLKRHLATGWNEVFHKFDKVRNGKTDTNNHGAFSTDFVGQNFAFPKADYNSREKIFQAHVTYQQGLMWCLANDPQVPSGIREKMSTWGLCKDEFADFDGWPYALYVREARRLISDVVMTEHHCTGKIVEDHSIGLAAYTMDSHNCRRLVIDGKVKNEGDVQVGVGMPYPIPYQSILPKNGECNNLLIPFCLSASHIAFGSIRMEPVFMVLAQSAAIAATIALQERVPLHEVDYGALKMELDAVGQILHPKQTQKGLPPHA